LIPEELEASSFHLQILDKTRMEKACFLCRKEEEREENPWIQPDPAKMEWRKLSTGNQQLCGES
jgi:endonuclease/exonuclease/phosphatase family metal-dependent hydrolase